MDIEPQVARLGLSTTLRKLADAVDAGDVHWVAVVALYTPEAAQAAGHAVEQAGGFIPADEHELMWMTALGAFRSAYLDFESHLLDIGARTVAHHQEFKENP